MVRVNWRELGDRFEHFDAHPELVHARFNFPGGKASYALRFYPWWEHPLYLEAEGAGLRGRFVDNYSGRIVVTIYPQDIREVHLTQFSGVIEEWWFSDEHPSLWRHHASHQILCTSRLIPEQLAAILDMLHQAVGRNGHRYLSFFSNATDLQALALTGAFSLGHFPLPVYLKICALLDSWGATYLGSDLPKPTASAPPAALIVDEENYIIADDFVIDIPQIEHYPEWFTLES
jgi:hypothetical protein